MKYYIYLLFAFVVVFGCQESKKEVSSDNSKAEKSQMVANFKSIELDIEGMTCEIGCAKLIESKLSKTEGITFSKVTFESKKGWVTYNSNAISTKEISTKIAGIAGGDLYSVVNTIEIESIPETDK